MYKAGLYMVLLLMTKKTLVIKECIQYKVFYGKGEAGEREEIIAFL